MSSLSQAVSFTDLSYSRSMWIAAVVLRLLLIRSVVGQAHRLVMISDPKDRDLIYTKTVILAPLSG